MRRGCARPNAPILRDFCSYGRPPLVRYLAEICGGFKTWVNTITRMTLITPPSVGEVLTALQKVTGLASCCAKLPESAMKVSEAIATRKSVRAFRSDPVDLAVVRDILVQAARAP